MSGPPPGGRLRLGQAAFATVYADLGLAALNIAVVPFLIGRLGTEPYGILGIVAVLAGQLAILHGGVGAAAIRLIGDSRGRGGDQLEARLAAVGIVAAVACLLVGGTFLLLAPTAWRSGFNLTASTLPIALAAVPPGAVMVAFGPALSSVYGVLSAREYFLFSSMLRLFQGSGRLLGAVAVVTLGGGVPEVFWAQAGVDLTTVAIGWTRARGPRAAAQREHWGEDVREAIRAVLKLGFPLALVTVLIGLLSDAEKIAVGLARSVEDFTYYSVPFNAVVKFTIVSGAVARVLMPRLAALGDADEAAALVGRADRVLAVGLVGVLVPVACLVPELLQLWLGGEFAERSTVATRILILGIAVNTAAFPAHALVFARARPAHLTILYAAELALHLLVVYTLVTAMGIVGAAMAWTLRMILDGALQRALAERTLERRLGDDAAVWGALAVLAALVALTPVLSLPARAAVAALTALASAALLGRGPEGRTLLDSVLPWRWGKTER